MDILCNFTHCKHCGNAEMLHGLCEHPNGSDYNIKEELLRIHHCGEIKSCTLYTSKEN